MFLYIIEKEEDSDLTNRWHDGGGIVIVANNGEHAIELVDEYNEIPRNERRGSAKFNVSSADILDCYKAVVNKQEPRVWGFPNAGCC